MGGRETPGSRHLCSLSHHSLSLPQEDPGVCFSLRPVFTLTPYSLPLSPSFLPLALPQGPVFPTARPSFPSPILLPPPLLVSGLDIGVRRGTPTCFPLLSSIGPWVLWLCPRIGVIGGHRVFLPPSRGYFKWGVTPPFLHPSHIYIYI